MAESNASPHRWRVKLPSLAGQLVKAGKDWRAYLQNIPESGTHLANWPGDDNTGNLYAVKHNPFPYVAEIQDDPKQFAKQAPLERRGLCRRNVGTFHTSSCVWQHPCARFPQREQ
jgi:hypothetical protein